MNRNESLDALFLTSDLSAFSSSQLNEEVSRTAKNQSTEELNSMYAALKRYAERQARLE